MIRKTKLIPVDEWSYQEIVKQLSSVYTIRSGNFRFVTQKRGKFATNDDEIIPAKNNLYTIMSVDKKAYQELNEELRLSKITLVAVSKTKPVEDILELYDLGHRDFGESYVQELVDKAEQLPKDIRWHFIGHLQTNKVKLIVPFVYLIHGVDSLKLLKEINKQAEKHSRVIHCLLQVHIAQEETKFGFDENELFGLQISQFANVKIDGVMGMASLTDDMNKVRTEFTHLKTLFKKLQTSNPQLQILSTGMSGDYKIAIEEGSNMVRIGSLLFGERNYQK